MDHTRLFNDHSDLYAAGRPAYPPEMFAFIKSHINGSGRAWDCATGSGQAALGLAGIFAHVDATDISENQLAFAAQNPAVRYRVCPAEKTPFDDQAFDLVNVAQALHWFDLDLFFGEVYRVLKPDGLFVVSSYAWSAVTPEVDAIVETMIKPAIAPYWNSRVQLCWNGYRDIQFPFRHIPVPEITMKNEWTADDYLRYIHTWSATQQYIASGSKQFFAEAAKALCDAWGNQTRIVYTPLTLTAGYRW